MELLAAWGLSVVGVVVLQFVAESVAPEGKIKKAVGAAFSLATLLLIISPLPKLLNFEFNMPDFSTRAGGEYAAASDRNRTSLLERALEADLENEGISGARTAIDAVYKISGEPEIRLLTVDLRNAVIDGEIGRTDINGLVKKRVKLLFGLNGDRVFFIG